MLRLAKNDRNTLLYALIFLGGCLLTVYAWSRSPGTPVEDEIAHLVIARNAWHYPELILHIWGRVGNTLIYMIPSLFGLVGARFSALLMSAATVLITTASARRMGVKRLWLIPLLLWFQPWYPSFGFTAITEVPFLLLLALGLYCYLTDRFGWMALCIGLLPLIRHEGILLVGMVFLYLLLTKHKRAALIPFLPLIVYNLTYQLAFRLPIADIPLAIYFDSQPTTAYGSGSWFAYVPYLIWETGYPIFFWALIGTYVLVRNRLRGWEYLLLYLAYFVIHSVIYHFGLFASGGYGFFIFPVAPALALLAALGVERLLDSVPQWYMRASRSGRVLSNLLTFAVIFVPVFIVAQYLTTWPVSDVEMAVHRAANWSRDHQIPPQNVIAPHIWFAYDYMYNYAWKPADIWSVCRNLDTSVSGTILVWDAHYSDDCGYSGVLPRPGWKVIERYGQNQVVIMKKS